MDAVKPPVTDLLASILANFGTKPVKEKRKSGERRALPKNAIPLTFDKAYAELKTGYVNWVAQAKIIMLEEQTCECCGTRVVTVKDEMFLLSNSVSHSAWMRHEGYGIEASEDLPIHAQHLEPRTVSACAACFSSAASDILDQIHHDQVQLHLPL
jgi:hypothetical protein